MKKSDFLKLLSMPLRKAAQDLGGTAAPVEAPAPVASDSSPKKVKLPKVTAASNPAELDPDEDHADAKEDHSVEPLTVRGKPVRVPEGVEEPVFDEKKGILHTTKGSFKIYLPQNDRAHKGSMEQLTNIMNDPHASRFHDYATRNWLRVHDALKNGTLPPEVIMHSTLFSQLSPNTPVPMQELMYSHLVDSMHHSGIDATSPEFASLRDEWRGRDNPKTLPEHSRAHFDVGGSVHRSVHLKNKSKTKNRDAGDVASFMLASNKFDNMEQYHSLHPKLVDLFNRHGIDARSAVSELMEHKRLATNHANRRSRLLKDGKGDIGEYSGVAVPGLAPKTGRYMAAMLGGGNVHVPDTHFIRYLFGLEKGTGKNPVDNRTINHLKSVLWNKSSGHILDGIDRYFAKHHPSVDWMANHSEFGHHFQGANRENAIFPAFWKTWMGIAPHERARGMNTMAFNEATDHRPFWEAIGPHLHTRKSESGESLPAKTAKIHADWVKKYGETAAQMMYFAYIVPQLMGDKKEPAVKKTESLRIIHAPLRKSGGALPAETEHPALASRDGGPSARFGIVTADEPKHPVLTPGGNAALEAELQQRGHHYEPVEGRYEDPNKPERSFLVHGIDPEELVDFGHRYGQDSVVYTDGEGRNKMIYSNGPDKGKFVAGRGWGHAPSETHPESYYSTVMHNGKPRHFSLGLNFDNGTFDNDETAFGGPRLVEKSMRKSESLRLIRAPLKKFTSVGHKGVGVGRIEHVLPIGTDQAPGPSSVKANSGKFITQTGDGERQHRSGRAGVVMGADGSKASALSPKRAQGRK